MLKNLQCRKEIAPLPIQSSREYGLETNAYSNNEVIIMVLKVCYYESNIESMLLESSGSDLGLIPPAPGAFEILDTLPVSHLGNSTIGI